MVCTGECRGQSGVSLEFRFFFGVLVEYFAMVKDVLRRRLRKAADRR